MIKSDQFEQIFIEWVDSLRSGEIDSSGLKEETRWFISSLDADARVMNRSIRKHWEVENSLHWTLDVTRTAQVLSQPAKVSRCGSQGKTKIA